ncbi:Fibronectin type III domain protein [Thermomonospora curvata DSM 43183]|uniref:Fibronectin type III domain protein n=1 Tax=Thermomonospora curvata (strain ATCC 19995 / DSM 43183 / JCM 3096 / KCTC 9072 / NBRC 15933 / NCIMB 10081 / Henssen B9) TaxID=471852 RepID=D1AA41_THECD|nr:Fibronectin type III domain protein [Thermomonospora curvata DSM 43183]PKK15253.1 MAG: hypothetical protein BUE48_006815 [Thermomonospora sp. CIF 1]
MPAVAFDKDTYRKAVLDPARKAGNALPADLFERYGLDQVRLSSEAEFAAHLKEVVAYWRVLRQRSRVYAKLIEALLAAHQELERAGRLTLRYFQEESRRRREENERKLQEMVAAMAATTPCLDPQALEELIALGGGPACAPRLRRLLAEHKIRLVDRPWELPSDPPIPASQYQRLHEQLERLGLRLSAEVVFGAQAVRGGFRLRPRFALQAGSGGTLTAETIAAAKARQRTRAQDESKPLLDSVLATLEKAAAAPGRLDELLVWEVAETLRPYAAAGLPARQVAERAAELGLVRDQAEELAFALSRAGSAAGAAPDPVREIEQALRADRLRTAQRLLEQLPADQEPQLRQRVVERARQADELAEQAARLITEGRTEEAAERLAAALRIAADDEDLAERLRALPPPAPQRVRTGCEGRRVTVAWDPAPARTGQVRYRVVRTVGSAAQGAGQGVLIGQTDANEVTDSAPPPGVEVVYTVFATRAEGVWSAPAAAPPLLLLPEVEDLSITAGEDAVAVTWRPPEEMTEVIVTRTTDDREQNRLPVTARDGFTDTDVVPGRRYRYRIQAVYTGPDGTRCHSRGLVAEATPQRRPEPVTDLSAEPSQTEGAPMVELSWTPPEAGQVTIRVAQDPPPWPPGTRVEPAELGRYGRELAGAPVRGLDGRMHLTVPAEPGRRHYLAVSRGAGLAVAGAATALQTVAAVSELTARRMGQTLLVSWVWPPGVGLAEVTWRPADGSAPPTTVECGRRTYEDNGGCRLPVGQDAGEVTVRAVVRDVHGRSRSRPRSVTVSAAGTEVRYEFRRRSGLRRRSRATLVLTAERRCRMPPLVVVHHVGSVRPLRPDQGEVICRVPARELDPATPVTVPIEVPPARGGRSWLVCFPDPQADESGDAITLRRLSGAW